MSESPQARTRCVCPSWTTAHECLRYRYDARGLESWEMCECPCHEESDDDDDDDRLWEPCDVDREAAP